MTPGRSDDAWLWTAVGHSSADSITVRGLDLPGEVMGKMAFGDLAFLLASGRVPTQGESTLFNAVLASLADHGLTPTALAARLTYTGAPESLQGAIAAGLLGGGSVFLGPVEDTARFLEGVLERLQEHPSEGELVDAARDAVRTALAEGRRLPGLGHPIHRERDPRTARIYDLAAATGLEGLYLRLLELVAAEHRGTTGKALPINGAGAAGAALADMGFPPSVARGVALLARVAGLVGHLAEEATRPLGMRLWKEVEARAAASSGGGSASDGAAGPEGQGG